jgi:hypothetical protein
MSWHPGLSRQRILARRRQTLAINVDDLVASACRAGLSLCMLDRVGGQAYNREGRFI